MSTTPPNENLPNPLDELFDREDTLSSPDRFGQLALESSKIAFTKDESTGKMHREGLFDPARHHPRDERDEVAFQLTPLDPSFPVVTREILFPSKEATLVKEALREAGLRPSDVNGAFVRAQWVPNGKVLGTYTGRDGSTRERTYLAIREKYADEAACRAAWENARTLRDEDGPPNVLAGGETPPAPAAVSGLTEAEQTEKQTLKAFLPVLAKGKTRAEFLATLAGDARFSRFFPPEDPDVQAVASGLAQA